LGFQVSDRWTSHLSCFLPPLWAVSTATMLDLCCVACDLELSLGEWFSRFSVSWDAECVLQFMDVQLGDITAPNGIVLTYTCVLIYLSFLVHVHQYLCTCLYVYACMCVCLSLHLSLSADLYRYKSCTHVHGYTSS
jgi:hypothetical protein